MDRVEGVAEGGAGVEGGYQVGPGSVFPRMQQDYSLVLALPCSIPAN